MTRQKVFDDWWNGPVSDQRDNTVAVLRARIAELEGSVRAYLAEITQNRARIAELEAVLQEIIDADSAPYHLEIAKEALVRKHDPKD